MWAGINHRGYVPRLHYATKQEDPTRWTGSNNSEWTGWQTSGVCDMYTNMDFDGIKDWSGKEYLFAMEGRTSPNSVSKYKGDPLRLGITGWTGHAYYTFHLSAKSDNRMRSGMMDGFRTPPGPKGNGGWTLTEMTSDSVVIINEPWKEGIKKLRVYSNCDEVELRLNGKVLARQHPVDDPRLVHLSSPGFEFEIKDYQPGEIEAVGLIKGQVKASDRARTPEEPAALQLHLDMAGRQLTADGSDIVMAYARVVDKHGTVIQDTQKKVHFTVRGPASIVGDKILPGANPMHPMRRGSTPVLVRAGTKPGLIVVRAEAQGLKTAQAQVTSVPFIEDQIVATALPIYDLEKVCIDLGEKGQLVQFGWTPWHGENNKEAVIDLPGLGGFRATLSTGSTQGITRWLGEMNVKGFHGFVMGEGVCVVDSQGLVLEFKGLPEGRYRLTTYHHAPSSNTNSMDPNRERLKTLNINQIPVAPQLAVTAGRDRKTVTVTSGKQLPDAGPGKAVVHFRVKEGAPATVSSKDTQGAKGIWLNGFELQQAR